MSKNTFTGEYQYTIDSKGRINIPAKFRSTITAENKNTFIITRGLDPCIVAYPLMEWKKVENALRNLSSASKIYRSFVRSTVRHATSSTFDKQGRIQITPTLKEWAGLDKEALIIGVVNKIEIWNPTRLQELEKSTLKIDPDQFEGLADKVIL